MEDPQCRENKKQHMNKYTMKHIRKLKYTNINTEIDTYTYINVFVAVYIYIYVYFF